MNKLRRQPIEQFGLRWRLRLGPKVVRIRNQTLTEVSLPDAIHPDPMRQRVIG